MHPAIIKFNFNLISVFSQISRLNFLSFSNFDYSANSNLNFPIANLNLSSDLIKFQRYL